MNNTLGENIARLRKEKGMTQEDLAKELNISYQAVSKWENGISSPDISNIKLLAQFFGVSIDMLFGLELLPDREAEAPAPPAKDETEEIAQPIEAAPCKSPSYDDDDAFLPWDDDNTLRAVLFRGRQLVSAEEIERRLFGRGVTLEYSGEALNVFSFFDVKCQDVSGNVEAGGDVNCACVGGNVSAGDDVSCEEVGSTVSCGGDADCGDVGGDVRAGGDVNCGSVIGSVSTGGDVNCGNVGGSVSTAGDVNCAIVGGGLYRR